MGSDSDLPVVRKALDTLRAFGVPYEVHVYSAHRTPAQAQAFCSSARDQGFGVLICAAGMAAHLAGAAAANTTLPVIGIPMASGGLGDGRPAVHGPDALRDSGGYGSRQWRSQRRHLAVQILAVEEPTLADKLAARRASTEKVLEKNQAVENEFNL